MCAKIDIPINRFRYLGNIDICFICKQYAEFNIGIVKVLFIVMFLYFG